MEYCPFDDGRRRIRLFCRGWDTFEASAELTKKGRKSSVDVGRIKELNMINAKKESHKGIKRV